MKNLNGIIIGAIAGIVAGILLAPDSGTKTRKILGKESNKWRNGFEKQLNENIDVILKSLSKAIDEYSKKSQKSLKELRKSVKV